MLGHSRGTMLAVSYLLGRPAGVRSVVLSSPCLDPVAWGRDQRAWLAELGPEQQRAVEECGASGETDSPRYHASMDAFYHRHVCRLNPWPAEIQALVAGVTEQVYGSM